MQRICAWCQRRIDGRADGGNPDGGPAGRISHGICVSCADALTSDSGTPVAEFLRSLDQPTVLVDEDRVVGAFNRAAETLAGGDADGRKIGLVFECIYAHDADDCGVSIHCSGCTIRHAVSHTYETGEPVSAPATLRRVSLPTPEDVTLRIHTERVGARVAIRVEEEVRANA